MIQLHRNSRRLLFAAGDVFSVLLANVLALVLRFDFDLSHIYAPTNRTIELLLIDLILTPAVFYATGLYAGYWKYTGLDDLLRLVKAVAYRTVGLIVIFYAL